MLIGDQETRPTPVPGGATHNVLAFSGLTYFCVQCFRMYITMPRRAELHIECITMCFNHFPCEGTMLCCQNSGILQILLLNLIKEIH